MKVNNPIPSGTSDRILYYPYINIPNNLWTSRALLYWDNVGVIVPENYAYNPEELEPHMRDLVSAQLVEQIIPRVFTQDLRNFKEGFIEIILSPKFNGNQRRKAFANRKYFRIHVEKFDNGLMHLLEELGLAKWDDWPWWKVESETAKILMTYLASVIAVLDKRSPLTDTIEENPRLTPIKLADSNKKMELRNRLLNDILPLPTKIEVKDLEKVKGKYSKELSRFRNCIEKTILDINQFSGDDNFEERYNLQLREIRDRKEFITDKLSEPKFGKVVFGTLCSLSATGIAVTQTPQDQIYWTIPSILSAIYTAVDSHKRNDIIRQQPLSYLALIDKQLKIHR